MSGARRFAALVFKEALQIIRDPSSLLIAGVLPFVLLILFGYAVSLDLDHVAIGVVVEQPGAQAEDLASAFADDTMFTVRRADTLAALRPALAAGTLHGIIVIPADFDRLSQLAMTQHDAPAAPVQVVVDGGANPNTAGLVQSYAQSVWQGWVAERAARLGQPDAPLISLVTRTWYNPNRDSHDFLVPGAIAVVLTIVGTLLTSLVIAREWERGTMEAVLATQVTRGEILAAKIVPYFILGLVAAAISTLAAIFLLGVPLRGSVLWLFVSYSAFLFAALGLGLLISTLTRNQFLASQVALIVGFLPAFMLSGFVFEIDAMPPWLPPIAAVLPARYLVTSLRTIFLVGDVTAILVPNTLVMLGMGALLLGITWRRTPSRLD